MKKITLLFILLAHFSYSQINIPDTNLKNALIEAGVDTNGNGEIEESEALAITNLNIDNKNISSLEGIEYFTNLTELRAHSNQITSLNLNNLTKLFSLYIHNNLITSLDFSNLTLLSQINISDNPLTLLNISNTEKITELFLDDYPELSTLITNENSGLEYLTIRQTNLNSADLTDLINLKSIILENSNLNSINTSGLNNLQHLYVFSSELVSADVSNSSINRIQIHDSANFSTFNFDGANLIESIDIQDSPQLTTLDVSNMINLKNIDVHFGNLSSLILNGATNLESIFVPNNSLTSLDFSGLTKLTSLIIDHNPLATLNISGATSLTSIDCTTCQELETVILDGANSLERIDFHFSKISSLDISNLNQLKSVSVIDSQLNTINLDNSNNIENLSLSGNQLTSIDVSNLTKLKTFDIFFNQLTSIDVSNASNLERLSCEDNQLETLFIKNGANENVYFSGNSNLTYICADDSQIADIQSDIDSQGLNATVNSYCSFTPGGDVYTIEGTNTLDINADGCDASDPVYPNVKYTITDGTDTGTFVASSNGNYSIFVNEGSHTITPSTYRGYYSINPSSITVDFPSNSSPFEQDFCLTSNGNFNDIEVEIIPIEPARPGFDIPYKIIYRNVGTTVLNGTLTFTFEDELMDIVSITPTETSQSTGTITWDYTDLQLFEEREVNIVMNINTPSDTPPVNGDDILTFTASVPADNDANSKNNSVTLRQTVVNSFDPNDKTCIQGDKILPEAIGEYLNYMIRFENTGTANAINVVIKDLIDTDKFDIETLIPLKSSHNFVTKIREGNIVEFIFEDINLPFDDANNDGYVTFKIKTLDTLEVGDTIENNAEIYFDFNLPIITNIAQTQIVTALNVDSYNQDNSVRLFPNPTKNNLQLRANSVIKSIKIYDILGKLITQKFVLGSKNETELTTSNLANGIYLLEIKTDVGKETHKIIKE